MDTKVVNIPFVGGINEFNDPDQLQPPELEACHEAVIRRPGRIEKRNGFWLVTGASGQPAQAFNSSLTWPSPKVEAMEAYYGQNGSRPVMAAGDKFYEFVGTDPSHGWREVNRLSTYVGSLIGVTASGGSMIEVETLEEAGGETRLTVWVSGQRTGQERTSDLVYESQTAGSGNAVYYALQRVETGAFIVPPTVLAATSASVGAVIFNLRVCRLETSAGVWQAFVTWQEWSLTSALVIKYAQIQLQTASGDAGAILSQGILVNDLGQHCHRSFDVVGTSALFKANHVLVVYGKPDTASDANPAELRAELYYINPLGGAAPALISSLSDAVDHTSTSATWWNPWAHRGVVLDQSLLETVGGSVDASIAFGARVISAQMVPGEGGPTVNGKLDGQLVLGVIKINPITNALTVTSHYQSFVQGIGFQTADDHTQVLTTTKGGFHYSGSVTVSTPGLYDPGLTVPHYPPATVAGDVLSAPVLTGFVNNSLQIYKFASNIVEFYPAAPYTAYDQPTLANSGWYPATIHTYRNDQAEAVQLYTDNQANWVKITASNGFNNGVFHGCTVSNAANEQICIASIVVVGGSIVEFAIEDGRTSVPGGGPFDYVIASITGGVNQSGGGNIGAGVVTGTAYTLVQGGEVWPVFNDIPNRVKAVSNPTYSQSTFDPQHCVHRWSTAKCLDVNGKPQVVLALTSLAANTFTTPNGAEPYGAASPHMPSNFFEVYHWKYQAAYTGPYCLNPTDTSASSLIAALGGPWRLVAGLQYLKDTVANEYVFLCAISPAGDEFQRSTFLVRAGAESQVVSIQNGEDSKKGPSHVLYSNNPGMFVESANMMRVTSMPVNVPNLHRTSRGLLASGFRDGVAKNTQQIFAIDYEDTAQNWRRMQVFSDYTFVNGGVPSVFDGVGVNEAVPLIWPQRDLTSINYAQTPYTYDVSDKNSIKNKAQNNQFDTMPCAFFTHYASNSGPDAGSYPGPAAFLLLNITRPYFKYEAGFLNPNGYFPQTSTGLVSESLGNAWQKIKTTWGGDPSKNYETVYSDPRYSQLNAVGKTKYNSGFNQADSLNQHYYGRYHASPADYSSSSHESLCYSPRDIDYTSLWVWAPRSAQGWGDDIIRYPDGTEIPNFGSKSLYNPADAGGDFLIRWTYEYIDGTGRVMRSCPSNAAQYTVCAEIVGGYKKDDASGDNAPGSYGGLVSVFKYGFFAPQLELTNRLKTGASDPRRITLQPYTTAEPFATVMYRMPMSSFVNPASDFVVNRNAGRSVVPRLATPVVGPNGAANPFGFVTSNLTVFDGPQKDFNGLLSEPYLYTTGGVLDNVPPPACKAMCMHQNRLVLGGADDATVVWFSKPITPTDSVAFNDALTITIGDGGPVMGLASLNGNLIVFKYQEIYVVPGTFPDATGYGPSLGEPFNLPAGVGCIDHRSVCETPVGVFFQSTRGLELLTPQLDVVPMTKVRETLVTYSHITSVMHYPANREVWFACHDTLVSEYTQYPNATMLVYNYQTDTWSTFALPFETDRLGRGMFHLCLVTNQAWFACANDSAFGSNTAFAYTYESKTGEGVYYDRRRTGGGGGGYVDDGSATWSQNFFTNSPIVVGNFIYCAYSHLGSAPPVPPYSRIIKIDSVTHAITWAALDNTDVVGGIAYDDVMNVFVAIRYNGDVLHIDPTTLAVTVVNSVAATVINSVKNVIIDPLSPQRYRYFSGTSLAFADIFYKMDNTGAIVAQTPVAVGDAGPAQSLSSVRIHAGTTKLLLAANKDLYEFDTSAPALNLLHTFASNINGIQYTPTADRTYVSLESGAAFYYDHGAAASVDISATLAAAGLAAGPSMPTYNAANDRVWFASFSAASANVVSVKSATALADISVTTPAIESFWACEASGRMTVSSIQNFLVGAPPYPNVFEFYVDTGFGWISKLYVPVYVRTAPIALNNVQGFQRIKRVRLLANPTPPNGEPSAYGSVNVTLSTDYALSGGQSVVWTKSQLDSILSAQGRFQLEVHVAEQKGQRLQVIYSETAPDTFSSTGFGFALSNIALVVGLKAGLDKRILPEAKH